MASECRFDPGKTRCVAIAGRDRDVAFIHEGQVALRQTEHVEVELEPRPGVERPERRGDPTGDAGHGERFIGHRLRVEPLEDEHVPLRDRVDHARRDASLRRSPRVEQLVAAVDREQVVASPGMRTKNGVPSTSTR